MEYFNGMLGLKNSNNASSEIGVFETINSF